MKRISLVSRGFLLSLMLLVVSGVQAQTEKPPPNNSQKPESRTADEIDPDDVIRINTTLVNSPVLVIGRDGKFVPSLKRDDFQLFEDGVPQKITYFSTVEAPFTVALLIDTSRSTTFELRDIKDAALSFVERMRPGDRALVVSFSDRIEVLTETTGDRNVLKQAIDNCRPGGGSRIYDALSFTLAEKLESVKGRTAVILFTDGVDNDSRESTYESSLQRIKRTQALIYPVKFETFKRGRSHNAPEGSGFSRKDYVKADGFLLQAATISGTGVYPARSIRDLDIAVASIVDELHNEYSVGYYPQKPVHPGAERKVEVRTRFPHLVLRARTSYSRGPTGATFRMTRDRTATLTAPTSEIGSNPSLNELNNKSLPVDERWICKSVEAPLDSVVVKEGFVSHCPPSKRPKDSTNAWLVRKPQISEVMCKGFLNWRGKEIAGAPVPAGYVVTSEVSSPTCSQSSDPKNTSNAWKILKPTSRQTICKGFTVPRGFVTERETSVAECPARTTKTNALIIRPK